MKVTFHQSFSGKILSILISILFFVIILITCKRPSSQGFAEEGIKVIDSLIQVKKSAADEMDIKKYLSPYDSSLEFCAFINGYYFSYKGFTSAITYNLKRYKKYELIWDTLYVRILDKDLVTAFVPFRETLIDTNGIEERMVGYGTWIAHHKNNNWKFIWADINVNSVPVSDSL